MAKSIIERIFLGKGYCDSVKLGKEYDKISRKVDEMYLKINGAFKRRTNSDFY